MKAGEIIEDIVFEYESSDGQVWTENAFADEAAEQEGATFRTVFGTEIATAAQIQTSIWASRGWSERDRDAAFPVALAASILEHAQRPEAEGLIGNPGEEQAEKDLREAKGFAKAYERQTGVALIRPEVSAHEELKMMPEAEEYAETGFCDYVESARIVADEYSNAERNRQAAQKKPVVQKSRQRQRCR